MGLVSLDIAKPYDTAWCPHTLHKLQNILSNGKMLNFIDNFLTEGTFSVKVNWHLSPQFQQENGVPQGSTMSVTLFIIAINSIIKAIKFSVKCSLFADDFNIFCNGSNPLSTRIFLQETINTVSNWSYKTGFFFLSEKSQCVFFTRKNKIPVDINLKIKKIKKSKKILGHTISKHFENNHCSG